MNALDFPINGELSTVLYVSLIVYADSF